MKITSWILRISLAAVFLYSGATTWLGAELPRETFDEIGAGQWLRYVTGALEIAGGVGLLIPSFAALSAVALSGLMVGAVATELVLLESGSAVRPLAVLAVCGVLAWLLRGDLKALTSRLVVARSSRTDRQAV